MPTLLPEPSYQHGAAPRTGVLLVNLGTPEAPTAPALRRYLKEFLSDPRVVEIPRAVWLPLLHGVILNTRPARSAEKYAQIWTPEGSPLRIHSERQVKLLKGWLGQSGHPDVLVDYGMRYGEPSIAARLAQMKQAGCNRLLVLPLYPQYAASTTASTFDALARTLARMRNLPELRMVRSYPDHPGYIRALAAAVNQHWIERGRGGKLVLSFHGVPRFCLDKGDPYHCECHKTARLLGEELGISAGQYLVTFQSRFGRAEWLKPYTQSTIEELARSGANRVDVICPGFVSDCLETLEEIAMECKSAFLKAGGKEFHYIPALNERPEWIAALGGLTLDHLGNWMTRPAPTASELARSAERAKALGAPA
jgi:ferrochelatase